MNLLNIYNKLEEMKNIELNERFNLTLDVLEFFVDYRSNELKFAITLIIRDLNFEEYIDEFKSICGNSEKKANYVYKFELGKDSYIDHIEDAKIVIYLCDFNFKEISLKKENRIYVEKGQHQGVNDKGFYKVEFIDKTEMEVLEELTILINDEIGSCLKRINQRINKTWKEVAEKEATRISEETIQLKLKELEEEKEKIYNKELKNQEKQEDDFKINQFKSIIEDPSKYKLLN